jgi:hypothetical protein
MHLNLTRDGTLDAQQGVYRACIDDFKVRRADRSAWCGRS